MIVQGAEEGTRVNEGMQRTRVNEGSVDNKGY